MPKTPNDGPCNTHCALRGRPSDAWLDRNVARAMTGSSMPNFKRDIESKLPREAIKNERNKTWIHSPALLAFLIEREAPKRPSIPEGADEETAMMYSGTGSPALEEYRKAKAALANLELQTKNKEIIPREQVHSVFATFIQHFQSASEIVQRDFGPEPMTPFTEAISEMRQVFSSQFGEVEV